MVSEKVRSVIRLCFVSRAASVIMLCLNAQILMAKLPDGDEPVALSYVRELFQDGYSEFEKGNYSAAKSEFDLAGQLISLVDRNSFSRDDSSFYVAMLQCVVGAKDCIGKIEIILADKTRQTELATERAGLAWLIDDNVSLFDAAIAVGAAQGTLETQAKTVIDLQRNQLEVYVSEFSMAYNMLSTKAKNARIPNARAFVEEYVYRLLRKAAEQGDAESQFNLGAYYYIGKGVEQDKKETVKWWRKAADQRHAQAQLGLGNCYDNGEGVVQDKKEAVKWYRKAAEQGNASAQYSLGVNYASGEGVEKNVAAALEWYHKAADQGDARAENNIGWIYYIGNGVKTDYSEAVKWFRKSVAKNCHLAQESLGRCYYKGRGVRKDFAEAARLFRLGAEQDDACAQFGLAKCLYYGHGCRKDVAESVKWLRKAAENGDRDAAYALGYVYEHGAENKSESEKWYRIAAEKAHPLAKIRLNGYSVDGLCEEDWPWTDEDLHLDQTIAAKLRRQAEYYIGQKNERSAFRAYMEAALFNDPVAMSRVGEYMKSGKGTAKNVAEAAKWFRKAAELGDIRAQFNLGVCYDTGEGCTQDKKEAAKWYRKAAANGDEGAKRALSNINKAMPQDATADTYCVIDLSAGANAASYPVSYLAVPPTGGFNTDEYKTAKLVLRRIEPGTFIMGDDQSDETHRVTLTEPFYCGVFEVTQRQYELVMGERPGYFTNALYYATRPVERVSYDMIRGTSAGAGWPGTSAVDADSFIGKLRAKTGILGFDLPTEAQWEYACRAGTTSVYNSGGNTKSDLNLLGRYVDNGGSSGAGNPGCGPSGGSAKVGSYRPNAWGLYDMHGNVWERCLDWYSNSLSYGINPHGTLSGTNHVTRGGSWYHSTQSCRSASRESSHPAGRANRDGFRLVRCLD